MDASLAVFILGTVNLALLGMLALEVRRQRAVRHEMQELRDAEFRSMIDRLAEAGRERRDQLKALEDLVDAHIRKDDAGAKAMAFALADRIDALSARMDAVELACGIREKAKTMGGRDG